MKKVIGYFYCIDSILWTVWESDVNGVKSHTSNYSGRFEIDSGKVIELGSDDHGDFIQETYTLWESLVELAIETECVNNKPEVDGEMSLNEAVNESYVQTRSFKNNWIEKNKENPEFFPMSFPSDNSGAWFEQMQEHSY